VSPSLPGASWKLLLKIAVSAGLLAFLFLRVELGEVGRVLATADRTLVAVAFLLYLAGQVLSALKWRTLSSAVGFGGPPTVYVRFYFIAMFFNAFGFGTVGGDLMRALYLAGGERRTLALNTVVADRVSGLLVLLVIALVALLAFRTYELPAVLYWSTLFLSAGLLAGWRLAPWIVPRILPVGNWFRRLVEVDLAPYWRDYRLLARASVMSLAFHLSQFAVLGILGAALALPIPRSYFFVFAPLVNVFSALPVSVNGLGVRESAFVFFLGHIGIGRAQAIAFALLWFAIVLLAGLVGGVVYLRSRDDRVSGRHAARSMSRDAVKN
jgi:glycosyltransferase 2 family protein